jgi:hypothetical protein
MSRRKGANSNFSGKTMRWVTAHHKGLLIHEKIDPIALERGAGFEESITSRAVHELLFHPVAGNGVPLLPALLAARAAMKAGGRDRGISRLAWVDSTGTFYPPAAMGPGISANPREQIIVLRPRPADLVWATLESLRCRSMGAVVAVMTQPLTRVEVRRLQLAAEMSGGTAVLVRPDLAGAASHIYAAATRWLVSPAPGERTIQRWRLQLVHGHGRQIGQSFILEKHRGSQNRTAAQTYFVPLSAPLVDHPAISAAS